MSRPVVVVVDLGRAAALGAARRIESWTRVFSAAGADVQVVRLVEECRTARRHLLPALAVAGVQPDRVPESALWSPRSLRERLDALHPDVVVVTTARSFAPGTVPGDSRLVLDYVDRLSANYAQRAALSPDPVRAAGLRVLSRQMARFEGLTIPAARRVAAGAADALALGVEWVPNVVAPPAPPAPAASRPTSDLVFLGTLDYAPNVSGLRRLAAVWPAVQDARPGTTLLVAGSRPTPEVRALVARCGWSLWVDFPSVAEVCAAARVALAPLPHGTGIQNKVLEAAAHRLPQVVTPTVLAGLGPDFPVVVAPTERDLVREVTALLDDPRRQAELAERAHRVVVDRFGVNRWGAWARRLLDEDPRPRPAVLRSSRPARSPR